MRTTVVLFLVLEILGANGALRGLQPSLEPLYDASKDFTCLDGRLTIPFDQVNDDYCDCSDGSDEPGTSACPNGKFFCQNAGHVPQLLASSRINDGICDCCDGTDEFESPEGGVCQDVCLEMGAEARARREREMAAAKEGYAIRQKLIELASEMIEKSKVELAQKSAEADVLRQEVEVLKLAKETAEVPEKEILDKQREEEERQRREKEELEKQREAEEVGKVFEEFDTDGDEKISKKELMVETKFDTNNDGIVGEEEVEFYLAGNEEYTKETFLATGWPLMKPVLTVDKNAKKRRTSTTTTPEKPKMWNEAGQEIDEDGQPIESHPEDDEGDDGDDDDEDDEEEDEDEDYDEEPEKGSAEHHVPERAKEEEKPKYDEASQAIIDAAEKARKEHQEAENKLKVLESHIGSLKETLDSDYGEKREFLPLKNECFEFKDHEYIYKLCAFDKCTQQGVNGGGETRLGKWDKWEGPENDPYAVMRYSNGQQCWNGPNRSTVIKLVCGTSNVVESVTEPNRCEYEMVFSSPAICKSPEHYEELYDHDEL